MRISSIEFSRKILINPETNEAIKSNANYKEENIAKKQYVGLINFFKAHSSSSTV